MPKRRPIPIKIKCLAAQRQLREMGIAFPGRCQLSWTKYLELDLIPLLEKQLGSPLQLDHDPALGLRKRWTDFNGEVQYEPHEHNHRHLVFRQRSKHLEKTIGRKADAERTVTTKGSDIWKMKKFRKLEGPPRRKQKIPSRPFPKKWKA